MMRSVPDCAVVYPCDGVSAERLVAAVFAREGMAYIRTSRPKTPVIYGPNEKFEIGGSKVLRENPSDVATVVAAGITVFEALTAYEILETMVQAGLQTGGKIITVEDHYAVGGLGDAVSSAVADYGITVIRLAVRETPRSGKTKELLERYGISASHIVDAVRCQTEAG